MLAYRCRVCNRIYEFSSPPPLPECEWCQGALVYTGEERHRGEILRNGKKKEKETANHNALWNSLKAVGVILGAGGAANTIKKYLKKEKIEKRDLIPIIIPGVAAGIIHGCQHRQELKEFLFSPESATELDEESRKKIQIVMAWIRSQTPQSLPQPPPERKTNFQSELGQSLTERRGHTISPNIKKVEVPMASQWLNILSTHPRVLILGGQGTGKSCLAFWLLEILHTRCRCFVFRLPGEGASYIPPWLGIIYDLGDAPPGSIVLVDEAYLSLFARESLSRQNRELIKIVNLARQKNLGLIFVAHEARHIDKNILSCIDTLVIKKPAPLQVALDHSFLKSYLLKAQSVFQGKSDSSSKGTSHVGFSPSGFEGVLQNPKPSFWSEKLSHIFASGNLGNVERPARELTKEEKKKRAKKLRDEYSFSYGEIAKDLGIGKTTVYRWLNENRTKR